MNTGRKLLRQKIRDLGVTQTEAASMAGVSQSLLSRILAGGSQPSVDTAFKIQHGLGIPAQSWCNEGPSRRGGPRRPRVASPAPEAGGKAAA